MNVHKGGEGHCKMKSAAPIFLLHPCTERGSPKILLLELGFATIRVCGRCSDGSKGGAFCGRGTARDVCETCASRAHGCALGCRVGWVGG